MKIKTLLALALVLVMAIFVVACGEDETTTEGTNPEGTVATTTKATTTKATTTKKTTVTTTIATTAKREIKFEIPAKLPDGKAYDATLIFDGTEADSKVGSTQKENGTGATYDIFTLADGNKVFAYHIKKDWMEANVEFAPYRFAGTETGVLFYADISASKANELACVGPRLRIDTQWYQVGSHSNSIERQPESTHNYGYVLPDGTAEWIKAENYSNCRLATGSQFKGWIYVPFTQLSQNGGNAQSLTDYIIAFPGECEFDSVMFYVGNVNKADGAESSDLYFDNFLIVTAK